ncbi:NAD(P)-dependent oxidoreductase [Evansella sp. AB-P1]|uniref:NAD(P)-dependent oxidoreductase n=1 Tax=Evansella sp. AB-P1 TaxID=3037653 RepID=UPI00241DA57B|nr:NAD(P)-dependent oxidoreductase [Evansella sp. AB-P1]MDG5786774.1 NAD(P)-dependent oxidoreductase [Evansella sp. AB-P1]
MGVENTVGFIGLGIMGKPMAKNLVAANLQVSVWNRTASVMEDVVELGATAAASPKDIAERSSIVFLMLANDAVVEDVVFGVNGVIHGASKPKIIINSSTVSPETSKSVYNRLKGLDIAYVEAPVTGSKVQAEEGNLNFLVGADEAVVKDCEPYFNILGRNTTYFGEVGTAATAKIANNSIVAINLLSLLQGLSIAKQGNVDEKLFLHVLKQGGANSAILQGKEEAILERNFDPQFSLGLMYKDLGLAKTMADELQVPTPMLSQAKDLFLLGANMGLKEEDMSAMLKCFENMINNK